MNNNFRATVRKAYQHLNIEPLPGGEYIEHYYREILNGVGNEKCTVEDVLKYLEGTSDWLYEFAIFTFADKPGICYLTFLDYPNYQFEIPSNAVGGAIASNDIYLALIGIHGQMMEHRVPILYPQADGGNYSGLNTLKLALQRSYVCRLAHYNYSLDPTDIPPSMWSMATKQQREQASNLPNVFH